MDIYDKNNQNQMSVIRWKKNPIEKKTETVKRFCLNFTLVV